MSSHPFTSHPPSSFSTTTTTTTTQELDLVSDTAPVFKVVGPVLMRVELEDAKQNVDNRLEFIKQKM